MGFSLNVTNVHLTLTVYLHYLHSLSVLGPWLFILYTADLSDKIDEHGINFHAYADDSQLYVHCDRCDTASAAALFEHCITDVCDWMSANRLKLNADKTELLWTGTKQSVTT